MINIDQKSPSQTIECFDQSFYADLIEALQDGICVIDQFQILLANQSFGDLVHYCKNNLSGLSLETVLSSENFQKLADFLKIPDDSIAQSSLELEFQQQKLGNRCFRIRVKTLFGKNGHPLQLLSFRDITPHKRLVEDLEQSEQYFKTIVEKLPSIYYRTDSAGILTKISPHSCEIMGYEMDQLIGQPLANFYADPKQRAETIALILSNLGKPIKVESQLRKGDGSTIWVTTSAYARNNELGEFIGIEGMSIDISAQKNLERNLRDVAIRDQLTQLLNRFGLQQHMEKSLRRAKRQASQVSIIFFDLDKFKKINDTFGHQTGDDYLNEFSRRLERSFRESDLISRIGGDEFVILLDDDTQSESISKLLNRLQDIMLEPFELTNHQVQFAYSYGIASYPKHGTTSSDLLNYADQQMYLAKNEGRC